MNVRHIRQLRYVLYWSLRSVYWRNDRPRRMLQIGRPAEKRLHPEDLLFFCCSAGEIDPETAQTKAAAIRFPDQSVNWSKYSRAWDVLIPDSDDPNTAKWIYFGVASFQLKNLPPLEISRDTNQKPPRDITWTFTAEHDPLEKNFAHTELRVYRDEVRVLQKTNVPSTVKKAYRECLSRQTSKIITPLI